MVRSAVAGVSLFVSPAEPPLLRTLGTVSSEPERLGADFLFTCPHGLVGVQRKEVRDLVASIRDDRICRELGQAENLHRLVLLIEGDFEFQPNGDSATVPGFRREQYDGLLLSFQEEGVYVVFSSDITETPAVLARIQSWFQKARHGSLRTRPRGDYPWGDPRNRAYAVHVLQGFDPLGPVTAGAIHDQFGTIPLAWTVSREELLSVPGIGKGRADALLGSLDGDGKVGA